MTDVTEMSILAEAHSLAAMQGKPQFVPQELAEFMGAFIDNALSPSDAIDSIFDGEMVHD